MVEDELSAEIITHGLETRLVGRKVLYYPSLGSTNEVAKREAGRGAPEGTVIVAGEQTRGKGRLKRAWLTPEGNIALSVILRPALARLPSLIMVASLAVVRSIEPVTGLKAQIKWPNDVLVGGKKVCGILIENDVRGNKVNHSVIGIGINVNLRPEDYSEIKSVATSLSAELGRPLSRAGLIKRLLAEMEELYLALNTGGPVYEEWRGRLVTLGSRVRVSGGEAVYEGIAEDVDRDGCLLLRGEDGVLTRIVAGDVSLRG